MMQSEKIISLLKLLISSGAQWQLPFACALGGVGHISEAVVQKVLQDAADHRGILPLFWFCVLCLLGLYHFRVVIMVDSVSYLAKQNPVILQRLESPEQ